MALLVSMINVIIFLIYYLWFKEVWGNSVLVLYGTSAMSILFTLIDIIKTQKFPLKKINPFLKMYILFGIYAFLTGIFVCVDMSSFLDSCFRYFSFVLVIFSIWYICYSRKNYSWLINTIYLATLLCSITATFFGRWYQVEVLVRTMSSINNPNTLGVTMVIGIFTILLFMNNKKKHFVLWYLNIIFFLLVIIRCGSRKALFSALALIIFGIYAFLSNSKSKKNKVSTKKIIVYISILISMIVAYLYIINNYLNSSSFIRLQKLLSDGGTSSRIELYKFAVDYWKTSPLFGIGLDQYKILCPYGFYSHSTYAELLSCTGVLGLIIFFYPIIIYVMILIKKIYNNQTVSKYNIKLCFLMIIVELFLATCQVFTFTFEHLLLLFCISYITEEELKN